MYGGNLTVAEIVFDPVLPLMYVFVNVKGNITWSNADGSSSRVRPFVYPDYDNYWRMMILAYDTTTMQVVSFSLGGCYMSTGADFYVLGAKWLNSSLWLAYNIGAPQAPAMDAHIGFLNPAYGSDGNYPTAGGSLGTTGVIRLNTTSLVPVKFDTSMPVFTPFFNFTSTSFHTSGATSSLFLSGSFTQSPLLATIGNTNIDLELGPRSACTASRGSSFEYCAGKEDGFNLQILITPGNSSATLIGAPHFVLSQATGLSPSRNVKSVSISGDNLNQFYACYSTNCPYIVVADNGDATMLTNSSLAFMHSANSVPDLNTEVFCTLRSINGGIEELSYTSMPVTGTAAGFVATAVPSTSDWLYFGASLDVATVFNITHVQGIEAPAGFVLTTFPSTSELKQLLVTDDNNLIISGTYQGAIEGAPSTLTPSGSTGLFVFYVAPSTTPAQILPEDLFALNPSGVTFSTPYVVETPASTSAAPQFLITASYVSPNSWMFNRTTLAGSTDGEVNLVWGIYMPNSQTASPPPIPVASPPLTIITPPTHAPGASSPSSASHIAYFAAIIMTALAALLL